MSNDPDDQKTATEKLAGLVASRKAALAQKRAKGVPGPRQAERAAGALSASKSKPALRK